jgi:trigger factor
VKSAVENLNPTRVKLTVEVPFDELKPSFDAAYRSIAAQVSVPGFRKGKVPPRIIDQRFGRGVVVEEAVNEALPGLLAKAVQENEVRLLGRPQVDITDVPDPSAGGGLRFTAEVDIRPAIDLPSLESVEVSVDDVEVTEQDVDERLRGLRERFGTLSTVERAGTSGDFVTVDIRATIGEEEIDNVSGVSYEVGSDSMLPGMDDVLPGMSAGEARTFTAPLAGGDRAGEESQVTLTVQAVKERVLPDADDDFAQLASEFDTLAELRVDMRTQAEQIKRYQQGLQARERLLEALLTSTEIPIPEKLISEEVERHLESESRGEDDEHRAEVDAETRQSLRSELLLDAIAEAEQVSVGQQELMEYLVISAQQVGMQPNEYAQAVDDAGQVPAMVAEVARRKALAAVLQRARVVDAAGRPVDLESIFPSAPAVEDDVLDDMLDDMLDDEPDEDLDDDPDEELDDAQPAATPAADDPSALPTLDRLHG